MTKKEKNVNKMTNVTRPKPYTTRNMSIILLTCISNLSDIVSRDAELKEIFMIQFFNLRSPLFGTEISLASIHTEFIERFHKKRAL
jgi:hypothetical protein